MRRNSEPRKSTKLAPNNVSAHINLAVAWEKVGHPDKAISCINRALNFNPNNSNIYNNLGTLLEGQNKPQEALKNFKKLFVRTKQPRNSF